jgi:hypothetical protein
MVADILFLYSPALLNLLIYASQHNPLGGINNIVSKDRKY